MTVNPACIRRTASAVSDSAAVLYSSFRAGLTLLHSELHSQRGPGNEGVR